MHLDVSQTAALTALAHHHGWLDSGDHVVELESAGVGNMNLVLRANLDAGGTLIFKQSLPYVAKYPDIPAPIERLDVEADFYDIIASHSALAMRTPAIVGYDRSAHILCMQDLGQASDLTPLYAERDHADDNRNPAVTTLVYWLWKLHALPLSDAQAERFDNAAMRKLNHEHIFSIPLAADNGVELSAELAVAAAEVQADAAIAEAAHRLGEIYLGNAAHASRPCLLHGDFYPGSWVRHETMGVMIIDPEFAFFGAPEFDIGVMLAHLTFAGFEQSSIMRTLQAYVTPPGFDYQLAMQFAGIEITRRLLGVAQLPLGASEATKVAWLALATSLLTPGAS